MVVISLLCSSSQIALTGKSLYLQVVIPGIANSTPGAGAYVPNKVCRTVDEAQNYATEYVLSCLGMPYDGK